MPTALIVGVSLFAFLAGIVAALLAGRSAQRRMEEAVRRGEARYRATLRALPDMLFVFSCEGIYLDFYAPDSSALYAPPDRFLGKHVREVMPPDLAARFEGAFAQALVSAEPVVTEYVLEVPSGRCEFEARIVRCGDDRLLSIVRDVTAGKVSARALTDGERELRASHRPQPDARGPADRRSGGRTAADRARPPRRLEPEAGGPQHRSEPPLGRAALLTVGAAST